MCEPPVAQLGLSGPDFGGRTSKPRRANCRSRCFRQAVRHADTTRSIKPTEVIRPPARRLASTRGVLPTDVDPYPRAKKPTVVQAAPMPLMLRDRSRTFAVPGESVDTIRTDYPPSSETYWDNPRLIWSSPAARTNVDGNSSNWPRTSRRKMPKSSITSSTSGMFDNRSRSA